MKRLMGGVAVALVVAFLWRPLFAQSCDGWFAYDPLCWFIGG